MVAFIVRYGLGHGASQSVGVDLGLGISYGRLRSRWWSYAPPFTVITVLLLPVGLGFSYPGAKTSRSSLGSYYLVWYIICELMIYLLYGPRLASVSAAHLLHFDGDVPVVRPRRETTYIMFVTILHAGIFMSLQTLAYVRTEKTNANYSNRCAKSMTRAASPKRSPKDTVILSSTLDREEVHWILEQIAGIVPSSSSDIMLIENGVARIVRHAAFRRAGFEHAVMELLPAVRVP